MRIGTLADVRKQMPLRVVLAGNPNAGKTTLFNALTHSNLRTGNFHGVTTSSAQKQSGGILYVDSPGLYAMNAYSMEEDAARKEIENADIVINVIDALTLENSLNLTRRIIEFGKPVIVYITKVQQLKKRGGRIDKNALERHLGVPVFMGSPKGLKAAIKGGVNFSVIKDQTPLKTAYLRGKLQLSGADKLFYNRFFALFFFIFCIVLMFFLAFHPAMIGAILKDKTEQLFVQKLGDAITEKMSNEAAISLVKEGLCGGAGSVFSFIPQLAILYAFLTLLDESGITSALAFATDGLFEKVNLSGRAAFSLISGFGCTAAAIMTTGGCSSPSAQRRTIAILPYIPCGAKLPVFLTFLAPLFKNPFPAVTCFYFAGLALSLLFSCILKGGKEGMLSEVTPIVFPSPATAAKKLYFYLKGFIIKVALTVTLFCVISWALSHYSFSCEYVPADRSMLAAISRTILTLFFPMGITDWRLSYAAICGFIAKENIAATVAMLLPEGANLALDEALSLCTFVLLSPACVSAFSSSCKEAGLKFTLKCCAVQLIISFLGAYAVHLLFAFI